ncbi:hypothetical protein ZWY2020_002713 [Hordeum vulgare]|nr:hypothetical protein ZWY2020_002713 [Hordeum vulgare]
MSVTPESTNPRSPFPQPFLANNDAVETLCEGSDDGRLRLEAVCAERARLPGGNPAGDMAASAVAMEATNAESARSAVRATDVALSRIEAIHAKIKDAHANIFQGTLESSMQPTYKKATEAMEHLLPHEITEQEMKMHEAT